MGAELVLWPRDREQQAKRTPSAVGCQKDTSPLLALAISGQETFI